MVVLMIYLINIWFLIFFFFKQKTAYEMRISDWSSDVCSSDLRDLAVGVELRVGQPVGRRLGIAERHEDHAVGDSAVGAGDQLDGAAPRRDADPGIGRASGRERVCQYV